MRSSLQSNGRCGCGKLGRERLDDKKIGCGPSRNAAIFGHANRHAGSVRFHGRLGRVADCNLRRAGHLKWYRPYIVIVVERDYDYHNDHREKYNG